MAEYLHPSISSRITDNSIVYLSAQGVTEMFQVITADKGPDNAVVKITSPSEREAIFGPLNMRKHGQAPYNVHNWVTSKGNSWVIRVLPDDATFSHAILDVQVKVEIGEPRKVTLRTNWYQMTDTPDNPNDQFAGAVSKEALEAELKKNWSPEQDGYKHHPLFAIIPRGRGRYNNMYFRLIPNESRSHDYPDFRIYDFEVYQKANSGAIELIDGPYLVSFDPESLNENQESMFIKYVIETYSMFDVIFDEDMFDELGELIDPEINPGIIDLITANDRIIDDERETIHENIEMDPLSYDPENRVQLQGGHEGEFDKSVAARRNAVMNLKIRAYKGLVDPTILNKKMVPIDIILDANEADPVKYAMWEFCKDVRQDFIVIADTGFTATPQQAYDRRINNLNVSSFYISIFTQDAVVYDWNTGSDIKVTSPWFLATKIPTVDDVHGIHWPFVGPRRGTITGYKSLSWNPTEDWKEMLYKKQVNYIESDPKRTKFATQTTSQSYTSALSDIPHVRTLLRIKRDVEELMEDYQMEFNNTSPLSQANFNLNSYLQKWKTNGACSNINGSVYSSSYDRTQKLARVKIEMKFTGFIERIYINLIVNR